MSRHTAFDPLRHGFMFANCFRFAWPWSSNAGFTFGLCGGMCSAALDYWREGRSVPEMENPPGQGTSLFKYLVRRQLATMTPAVLMRLARRILADQAANDRWTLGAWPNIQAQLDAGVPVMLVLVRTKGRENPTENHQVLCTGYDLDPRTALLDLALYDPIYPCDRVWLHLHLVDPQGKLDLRHSRGDRVRGFFASRYRASVPPVIP